MCFGKSGPYILEKQFVQNLALKEYHVLINFVEYELLYK